MKGTEWHYPHQKEWKESTQPQWTTAALQNTKLAAINRRTWTWRHIRRWLAIRWISHSFQHLPSQQRNYLRTRVIQGKILTYHSHSSLCEAKAGRNCLTYEYCNINHDPWQSGIAQNEGLVTSYICIWVRELGPRGLIVQLSHLWRSLSEVSWLSTWSKLFFAFIHEWSASSIFLCPWQIYVNLRRGYFNNSIFRRGFFLCVYPFVSERTFNVCRRVSW